MRRWTGLFSFSLFTLLAAIGCGGDSRFEITGSVSYQGRPIESGSIDFQPLEDAASSGSASISNGRYTIPQKLGLTPGKYRVSITTVGAKPQAKDVPPGSGDATPPKEKLPEKYNSQSTLTYQVVSGKNEANFNLE
jgi:hypothetical protein